MISPTPGRTSIRHSYAAVVISILTEHIVGVLHHVCLITLTFLFLWELWFSCVLLYFFFVFGLYALHVIESIRYGDTRWFLFLKTFFFSPLGDT